MINVTGPVGFIEKISTDRRSLRKPSGVWHRELPIPIRFVPDSIEGHRGAELVGFINVLQISENVIYADGVIDEELCQERFPERWNCGLDLDGPRPRQRGEDALDRYYAAGIVDADEYRRVQAAMWWEFEDWTIMGVTCGPQYLSAWGDATYLETVEDLR